MVCEWSLSALSVVITHPSVTIKENTSNADTKCSEWSVDDV